MRNSTAVLAIVTAAMFFAVPAHAQSITRTVKSGQPVFLYGVFNCLGNGFNVTPIGQKNGEVWTKGSMAAGCGKEKVPSIGAWYKSNPGFKGTEKIFVVSSGGVRVEVNVIVQ